MKKSTRLTLMGSPAVFILIIGLVWIYVAKPFVIKTLQEQFPRVNQKQNHVSVRVENFDISLLKLQLELKNISLQSNKDSTSKLTSDLIRLQINPFDLIIGQISLSFVEINKLQGEIGSQLFKTPDKSNKEIDLSALFKFLPQLPLKKIILRDSNILYTDSDLKMQMKFQSPWVILSQNQTSVTLMTKKLGVVFEDQQHQYSLQSVIDLTVQKNAFTIKEITVKTESSAIRLQAQSSSLKNILTNPQFSAKASGLLLINDIKPFLPLFINTEKRIPQLSGKIKFNGELKSTGLNKNSGRLTLETENTQIDYIKLGNATIQTQINNNDLKINQVLIDHPSGQAQLTDLEISQKSPYQFKSKVQLKSFNATQLFKSIELNVPVHFLAQGSSQCSGQLDPLNVNCKTELTIDQLNVKSDRASKNSIVEIDRMKISADLQTDIERLKYSAQVYIKDGDFQSTGEVGYKTGFKMQFNSKKFILDEIKNISGLGLKGIMSGDLTAQGDSQVGKIDSQLIIDKAVIDRFHLGQLKANMIYDDGRLIFKNLVGIQGRSKYQGQMALNFRKNDVAGDLQFTEISGEDLLQALNKRFDLPFELTGLGTLKADFNGPLDFWKLNYNLNMNLNNGAVLNETYRKLTVSLKSDGERIYFNQVQLQKPVGLIQVDGSIYTKDSPAIEPDMQLKVSSKNLKIEDLDSVIKYLPKAAGQVFINGQITQSITNPQIDLQVSLKDMLFDNQPLGNSQGDIIINKNIFSFNGQAFGRQAQAFFQIPFNEKNNFIFKSQLRSFNPLLLLPFIKLPLASNDSYASITADIDLKTAGAASHSLNGQINLESFILVRGSQSIKLQKPSLIKINNSISEMMPLHLKGNDQELFVKHNSKTQTLDINGEIALRPFQFLVPFIDNFSGLLNLDMGIRLNSPRISFVGRGAIKNTSLQLQGFPYPIKDIFSDIDFSNTKIIFRTIKANLNQSNITGRGLIDFKGGDQIDVQIQAESEKIEIDFPEKILTSGFVKAKVSGQRLPYTLKIDYLIDQGLVTKEFTEQDENIKQTLQPSYYLPQEQLNQQAPTLLLDVNAKFQKGLLVKNQIIEGVATGEMQITGSTENPVLSGRIDIQKNSKLFFKDKPFDIQSGYIIFAPTPVIDPEIYITANARVTDYDINLLVQGRAKSLSIKPTSQPPLNENEIVTLLALGLTTAKQDQSLSSDTQTQQTGLEVLAALGNQSQFNKKIQEKLGLNVQLSPSIDSTKNIAVPKVIVSRKLGKKVNASYARPLTGTQESNEVKLQWLFHPDFSLNLNYQNQTVEEENNVIQNNANDKGFYGVDLEYKKEFK